MNELVSNIRKWQQYVDESFLYEVDANLSKIEARLRQQPGITNVQYESKVNEGLFQLEFHFSHQKAANKAMLALAGINSCYWLSPKYVKIKRKKIKKKDLSTAMRMAIKKNELEEKLALIDTHVNYNIMFTLPEKIIRANNRSAIIHMDSSHITYRWSLNEYLSENQRSIRIRY